MTTNYLKSLHQVARNYFHGLITWSGVLKAAKDLRIPGEVTPERVERWYKWLRF